MRTLNLGDHFLVSKKAISEMLGKDRVDEKNVNATIKFFENNGVEYFRGVVSIKQGNMDFEQHFLDKNKEKVEVKARFGNSFLLHLDSICEKEESFYSGKAGAISDPFIVKDSYFYDGDLYSFPLSSMVNYDLSKFSDSFNESIKRALNVGLKNIVFSVSYKDGIRKSAGDDLSDYYSDKNTEDFDYSQFSMSQSPVVRLFITNNLGENHFSLSDLNDEKDYEDLINDNADMVSRKFFSEKVCAEYNSNVINFITTLKENTLSLLLGIKEVRDNLEFIGNFSSEDKNFIGTYEMRNYFKLHQLNKMTELDNIKAILIDKDNLSKEEKEKMDKSSTHLMILPLPNQLDNRYTNLVKVEAVFNQGVYIYQEEKENINVFDFNKLIQESKDINIVRKNDPNEIQPETKFEYNKYKQWVKENSEVFEGIEKGYVYLADIKDVKHEIKSKEILEQINYVESLGATKFILNVSSPHYFLMSDSSFENNDKIYINRSRFVEMRLYPLSSDLNIINTELLSMIPKEDLTPEIIKLSQEKKGSVHDVYNGPFQSMESIKLESYDTINVIHKVKEKMILIEDRKNPYFEMTNSLNDAILKMFSEKARKNLIEEKEVKKNKSLKR